MKTDKKISIIIPTFNEELFLPNMLESLTFQEDANFETLVVDGGSGDKTVDIARSYKKKLNTLILLEGPSNVSAQRNLGAKRASGDILLFVDADSVFFPYTISRLRQLLGKKPAEHFTVWFSPDSQKPQDAVLTLLGNLAVESSSIVKRPVAIGIFTGVAAQLFAHIGGYNESITVGEDVDLSRKIAASGGSLVVYREALCIASLRRYRKQGIMNVVSQNAQSILQILFTKRTFASQDEYVTGGQEYKESDLPDVPLKLPKKKQGV